VVLTANGIPPAGWVVAGVVFATAVAAAVPWLAAGCSKLGAGDEQPATAIVAARPVMTTRRVPIKLRTNIGYLRLSVDAGASPPSRQVRCRNDVRRPPPVPVYSL
jgi:hypothetical protein